MIDKVESNDKTYSNTKCKLKSHLLFGLFGTRYGWFLQLYFCVYTLNYPKT